jgi:hypothetical protein
MYAPTRRGARVVEGARLERVYGRKVIQGSNPCLSATLDEYVIIVFMYSYRKSVEQFEYSRYLANRAWVPSDHEFPESLNDKITLSEAFETITGAELWHAEEVTTAVNELADDSSYTAPRFEELRQRANAINYLRDLMILGDPKIIRELSSVFQSYKSRHYETLFEERQTASRLFCRLLDPYVSVAEEA